jgi:hypothetical protein
MMRYLSPFNPVSYVQKLIGGVIFWLLFSWFRRSLVDELRARENELWHAILGAAFLLGMIVYAASRVGH